MILRDENKEESPSMATGNDSVTASPTSLSTVDGATRRGGLSRSLRGDCTASVELSTISRGLAKGMKLGRDGSPGVRPTGIRVMRRLPGRRALSRIVAGRTRFEDWKDASSLITVPRGVLF